MCKEHRLFCAEASFCLFDFVFLFQFFLLVIVVCFVLFLRLGLYVALLAWNSLCSGLPPECRIKGVGLPARPDEASVAHWLRARGHRCACVLLEHKFATYKARGHQFPGTPTLWECFWSMRGAEIIPHTVCISNVGCGKMSI